MRNQRGKHKNKDGCEDQCVTLSSQLIIEKKAIKMRIVIFFLFICSFLQAQDLSRDERNTVKVQIDGKTYYKIQEVKESEPIDSAQYVTNQFNLIKMYYDRSAAIEQAIYQSILTYQQDVTAAEEELNEVANTSYQEMAFNQYLGGYDTSLWIIRNNVDSTMYTAVLTKHRNPNVKNLLLFQECVKTQNLQQGTFSYTITPKGKTLSAKINTDRQLQVLLSGGVRIPLTYQGVLERDNNPIEIELWRDGIGNVVARRFRLVYKKTE